MTNAFIRIIYLRVVNFRQAAAAVVVVVVDAAVVAAAAVAPPPPPLPSDTQSAPVLETFQNCSQY